MRGLKEGRTKQNSGLKLYGHSFIIPLLKEVKISGEVAEDLFSDHTYVDVQVVGPVMVDGSMVSVASVIFSTSIVSAAYITLH